MTDQSSEPDEPIPWTVPDGVDPDFELTHPRTFCNPDAVARARRNAGEDGPAWGRRLAGDVLAEAEATWWADATTDEIRDVVPEPGARFQFGNVAILCPRCGERLEPVGWADPGTIRCEAGHEFSAGDGESWTDDDGEPYDFGARWNGFVVRDLTESLEALALAYALTEESAYAERVVAMLDALATTYPTATEGPTNHPGVTRGEENGRLTRPGYQVARTLVRYVAAADLVWESDAFEGASPTNAELSRRENVAYNMLLNGADFCERWMCEHGYDRLLHNGTADYVRGLFAVGAMFGVEEYVAWATESRVAFEFMLANNVDRDGGYYETAMMYSEHARRLYASIAEIFYNLDRAGHPAGWNYYDDERFDRLLRGRERLAVAGRLPNYGDSGPEPDVDVRAEPFRFADGPTVAALVPDHTFTSFTEIDSKREAFESAVRSYARTEDPERREAAAERVAALAAGDPADALRSAWHLFNVDDVGAARGGDGGTRPSELLGGSGVAVLRPGDGEDRGAFFRYGPTLSHGHADELGVNLYAAGREISYDPGYGKAHYRNGWCRHTVAHLAPVVDERTQLTVDSPGGSLRHFHAADGLSVVEAADEGAYPDLDLDAYRRTLATVDAGEGSYVLDVVRIDGGETRDYPFHALGTGFETTLDPGDPGEGSLASPDYDWGASVRGDGKRSGDGVVPEKESEGWRWIAPPGNGYGFLGNPRRASGADAWRATWTDERRPEARTRLTMLGEEEREVVLADGPTPMSESLGESERRVPYALARDTGDDPSQFVALVEGTDGDFPVESCEALSVVDADAGTFAPVAVRLDLADGRRDYVASAAGGESFVVTDDDRRIETDAAFLHARFDESGLVALREVGATQFAVDGVAVTGIPRSYEGVVGAVDAENRAVDVETTPDLPAGDAPVGARAIFDAPEYSHNSPYRIERVEPVDDGVRLHLGADLVLSRGRLESDPEDDVLPNEVFLSFARNSVHLTAGESNRYFDGKRVVNADTDAAATVESVGTDAASLAVDDATGFAAGDGVTVHDVKPGDEVVVPTTASVERVEGNAYALDAPPSADATAEGETRIRDPDGTPE